MEQHYRLDMRPVPKRRRERAAQQQMRDLLEN